MRKIWVTFPLGIPILCLFIGKPNLDLENIILTYAKEYFMKKNDPNSPDFKDNYQIARFL
jgi:hypothetical protein